ncbi:MAG: PEP-CTERM sorting domain-containing protein [Akkermansia sp.]|nr:PEP-CTERM sorting domain-containing protein [Akkermansia sp.]
MKKTLIALLALGTCAMGVTLEDADRLGLGGSSFTTTDGNFTVALTLDVTELRSILEQGQPKSWGTDIVCYDINGTKTGVTVNGGSNSSNTIVSSGLYARWGDNINWNSTCWTSGNDLATIDWDTVADAGLVYSFSSTGGTSVAFTLLDAEGAAIVDTYATAGGLKSASATASTISFDDSVIGVYYFNGGVAETDAKALAKSAAVMTGTVPEPTTATLSLLALAGLAARRRR